jgi:hypothetical protein
MPSKTVHRRSSSGSLAKLDAMRLASSLVSSFAADRLAGSSDINGEIVLPAAEAMHLEFDAYRHLTVTLSRGRDVEDAINALERRMRSCETVRVWYGGKSNHLQFEQTLQPYRSAKKFIILSKPRSEATIE